MRGWGFFAGLLALLLTINIAHAEDCPAPPAGSKPGWNLIFYNKGAKVGGLMPDAAFSAVQVKGFPLKYADIPGYAVLGEIPKLVFKGSMVVCTPGRYEFALIIESGPSRNIRSLLCSGALQNGETKLFDVNKGGSLSMVERSTQRAFAGFAEFERGTTELALVLTCGGQFFGGMTDSMTSRPNKQLLDSVVTLRVRAPGDSAPRELRDGEIFTP